MRFGVPHPIPYQGSKRLLAPAILSFIPKNRFRRLIEPFAGSAAITLAAAQNRMFKEYVIADLLKPLAG
ncbi:MAG: DNA adenine methylase, partial [Terriglobales bacterium]